MKRLVCKDAVKMFPITSVCREDLLQAGFKPKDIKKLDDGDMIYLASKMANAYLTEQYWIDLKIIAEYIFSGKERNEMK